MDFLGGLDQGITMIRVGKAGTMTPNLGVGDVANATASIRAEGVTDKYVDQDYVPMASLEVVSALAQAYSEIFKTPNGEAPKMNIGPKITKDSLKWEIGNTPLSKSAIQTAKIAKSHGIIASSMESSILYTLLDLYSKHQIYAGDNDRLGRRGSILAIVNNHPDSGEESLFADDQEKIDETESIALAIAEGAIGILYMADHGLLRHGLITKHWNALNEVIGKKMEDSVEGLQYAQKDIRDTLVG